MNSRLCSPLLIVALLAFLALPALGAGCYAHQGKPVDATPDQLLAQAHEACRRHDPDAWQMLLVRLTVRHPDTPQAAHARQLLDEQSGVLASCQRTLQAAEARD